MKQVELIKNKSASALKRFKKLSLKLKLGAIILLLVIGWFVRPFILGTTTQAPELQTATAERGTLISTVTASGSIASGNSASITTAASGVVSEVYVASGDSVNQGDTIATLTLDSSSLQKQTAAWASYLSAQNALNTAKSKMNSLQSALFTANQKFVKGAGTQNPITDDPTYIIQRADWLQAESDYNNQKGVIAASEAGLSSAWLSYAQTSATITAPITGTVSNLTLAQGVAISGNSSTNSTTNTTDTSESQSFGSIVLAGGTPQAIVNLSEIDVTKVKNGQKVTLTLDAFPDKTFTGKIVTINTNGSVSSGVTTYPATISLDTSVANMYPNMAVSASIITDVKNNVILVPMGAVQTSNGESSVRVLRNNQQTSVPVEVGNSNDTQTEIVSGVSEGDTVITGQTNTTNAGQSGTTTSPFGNTRGGFGGQGGFGGGARPGGGAGGAGAH